MERQAVLVRLEGEVNHPGNYFVAPGTPLSQVLEQAGGLTSRLSLWHAPDPPVGPGSATREL
jgi:protein involved in polysaccharide export with SLBB domain